MKKIVLVIIVIALLLPFLAMTRQDEALSIVNLYTLSAIRTTGRSTVFRNDSGVPILITDIEMSCAGTCNGLALTTPRNEYRIPFGNVQSTANRSLTTGMLWLPGEDLQVFMTTSGPLFVAVSGVKL